MNFYKFENFYFGNVSRMETEYLEWIENIIEFDNASIKTNGNYSYPTLLLKINDNKYIDLFHEQRDILIERNINEKCYILNYVEPAGNYFPQDMLNNKKYLTKKQAIDYFGDLLTEFDRKNSNKNDVKIFVYKKNNK